MTDKQFAIQPIETTYNGVKYRSRTEARWAVFFDSIGLRAQYEADGFLIREGGYLPDFWLPDVRVFLEVKGVEPTIEERTKCSALTTAASCDVLIAIGAPEMAFSLLWCDREGWRDDRFFFAHDRYADAGFWLVGQHTAHVIGPSSRLPGGPITTLTDAAYETARSERFGPERRHARVDRIVFPTDAHEQLIGRRSAA
jgi:hypothetical protein